MDAALVVERQDLRTSRPQDLGVLQEAARLRKGDLVVCGMQGVRVAPDVQQRDKPTFGFMSNEVSSERRVETAVKRVAE